MSPTGGNRTQTSEVGTHTPGVTLVGIGGHIDHLARLTRSVPFLDLVHRIFVACGTVDHLGERALVVSGTVLVCD